MGSIQEDQVARTEQMERSLAEETSTLTETMVTEEAEGMSILMDLRQERQLTFLGSDPEHEMIISSLGITHETIMNSKGQAMEEIIRVYPQAYKAEDLMVEKEVVVETSQEEKEKEEEMMVKTQEITTEKVKTEGIHASTGVAAEMVMIKTQTTSTGEEEEKMKKMAAAARGQEEDRNPQTGLKSN